MGLRRSRQMARSVARRKGSCGSEKRGGDWRPLTLSTSLGASIADGEDTVLKVHEALEDLETADPRLAQVTQMRYFVGYSEQEIAETLDITERTV
jgi:DNA-directed RNA polymerase specialized sigma24 family protein